MERTISRDERIRRAEEIYQRRKEQNYRTNQARVNVGDNGKDYKLFKKVFIQIAVCLLIYFGFYTIKNSDYIFSEAFLKQTKEVLSYDVNVSEIYNSVSGWFTTSEATNSEETEATSPQATVDNIEIIEKNEKIEDEKIKEMPEQTVTPTEDISINEPLSDAEYIKINYSIIKPLTGTITSRFGPRSPTTPTVPTYHTGIDIAANTGTKFITAMSGIVVQVSSEGDYGNHIKIKKDDVYTLYAHCSEIYVKEGDEVTQGQEIGEVGETGNATGPHLHFEIRREDRFVNPEDVLVF